MTDVDPERFAYEDDSVCAWGRDSARASLEAEAAARALYLQTIRQAARDYAHALIEADAGLINRFCFTSRRHDQRDGEVVAHFVAAASSWANEAIDFELLDGDKLRDLREIAGETE